MNYTLPIIQKHPADLPIELDEVESPTELKDAYGRVIRDLRVSLTDRCNFRCVYCMDPDAKYMRKVHMLTDSQTVRAVRVAVSLGVRRVRLTGGEPTLHPTLKELIADLSDLGLEDLSMTTNGSISSASDLITYRRAGLRRLTISLDSLRADRFARVTRSDSNPGRVLETVVAAKRAGLKPVRLNAVIVRGFNDDEIGDLANLARELDIDVRLIEYMPLDSGREWEMKKMVGADEMISCLESRFAIEPVGRDRRSSPATIYRFRDGSPGRIGIVASVTRPFCGACSRLRLTADGKIMPCLFSTREYDLRPLLRDEASTDKDIARFLAAATARKQAGHEIRHPEYVQPHRGMFAIGG